MGAEDIYFKTMEAVFFSTSDICFMTSTSPPPSSFHLLTHTHTGPYADNSGPLQDDQHSTCSHATACVLSQGQNKAVKNFTFEVFKLRRKKSADDVQSIFFQCMYEYDFVHHENTRSGSFSQKIESAKLSGLTPGVSYCSVESAVSLSAVYTGLQWTPSPRQPAETKPNLSQLYLSRLSSAQFL